MGPKLGLKLVQARDLSTHEQHQMEVSKSSLGMRPVEVRMMSWTLPMRQMYHKGVCPCLTSLPQMMRIPVKCKVCELAHKSDMDFTAWKDKLMCEGVAGIQERDSMVNDYADAGKRRPKNPDTLGAPFPT